MSSQSQESGFVTFLKGLFKLIIAILMGLLIGGAFFIAGSYIYQQAVIPSQNNTAALQTMQNTFNEQLQQLKDKNSQLDERITTLEISQTDQTNQMDEMQITLEQNQTNLETLLTSQGDVDEQVTRIEDTLLKISKMQYDLGEENETLNQRIVEVETQDSSEMLKPLQLEIELLKVMQQLNRGRLLIFQENYGLAKEEITLSIQSLEAIKDLVDPNQLEIINTWQERLELINDNLPEQPNLADEDLEVLWQSIAAGFPQETLTVEETAVSDEENLKEATAAPETTETPEPTPTPKP